MDARLIPSLRCPRCGGAPDREAQGGAPALQCAACGQRFPLRDGVLDMLGPPRPPSIAQLVNELPPAAWAYERTWRPRALTLLSGEPLPYERELALIARWAAPERGGLIVDLACSNGLYARALARQLHPGGGPVVGIDHAMPMLREARRRALAEQLAISYVRAEAQALPLQRACASTVVIGGSLNEIGDLGGCLREVARVLMPGGRFVAMTLTRHPGALQRGVQRLLATGGIQFWGRDALIDHFTSAGLRTVDQEQHGIVLFTLAEAAPSGA